MKILICYFSGTGNTQKIVNCYADVFATEYGDEVTLARMEDKFDIDVNDYDLLGIAYPVHAFNAPSIALNFCKRLPKLANKKPAFIVSSSGEPLKLNNIASLKLTAILKRRNIIVNNEYRYCMPYNIIFRHGDEIAYRMWNTARLLAPLDVKEINDNTPRKLKRIFLGGVIAWIMRCEHWGGRLNGKQYKVNDQCVSCKKCINICPTHNIRLEDGKMKFGGDCLMCMRCAHLCPTDAIKIGWFNKWKVNGAYSFKKPKSPDTKSYNKMLTKAYKKYFEQAEKRIAESYPAEQIQAQDKDVYTTDEPVSEQQ